jgi:hypothetical protein
LEGAAELDEAQALLVVEGVGPDLGRDLDEGRVMGGEGGLPDEDDRPGLARQALGVEAVGVQLKGGGG